MGFQKRSRCLLHRDKLQEFSNWCVLSGYNVSQPKANYQILRVDCGGQHPAIVYDRHNGDHFTVFGLSFDLVKSFLKSQQRKSK